MNHYQQKSRVHYEDELNQKFHLIPGSDEAKRREIARAIIRFADAHGLSVNWPATIQYIRSGECSETIIQGREFSEKTVNA